MATPKKDDPQKAGAKAGVRRASASQITARVSQVYKWIIDGMASYRVCQIIAENQVLADNGEEHDESLLWNVNERQVRNYYAKAEKEFARTQGMQRDQAYGRSLIRMNELYRIAVKKGDLKSAYQAELRLQELLSVESVIEPTEAKDDKTEIILPTGEHIQI